MEMGWRDGDEAEGGCGGTWDIYILYISFVTWGEIHRYYRARVVPPLCFERCLISCHMQNAESRRAAHPGTDSTRESHMSAVKYN